MMQGTANVRLLSPCSQTQPCDVSYTPFAKSVCLAAMLQVASTAPGFAAPSLGRSSRAPRRVRAQALVVVSHSRPAVRPRALQPRLACSPRVGGAVVGSGRQLGRVRRGGVCAARGGGYEDSPTAAERVVAALPYLLPLLDGLRYGKFFFLEFPQAQLLLLPLQPVLQLYTTVPFASVIAFFGLYLGIVQYVRCARPGALRHD